MWKGVAQTRARRYVRAHAHARKVLHVMGRAPAHAGCCPNARQNPNSAEACLRRSKNSLPPHPDPRD
eukprot:14615310-Alexandrium_andersonii.AAC.1